MIREIKSNPAIANAQTFVPAPDHFTGGTQFVEITWPEIADSRWQDRSLPIGSRQRNSLQLFDDVQQTVQALSRSRNPLPNRQEPRERHLLDRLHLLAEFGQRATFQDPQHFAITPLAACGTWQEFSFNHPIATGEFLQSDANWSNSNPKT